MLRYALVLFTLVLSMFGSVWADDYYVDVSSGSDSNSGRSAQDAWKTIKHALDSGGELASAVNPITVHIAEGVYSPLTGESFPLLVRDYVSLTGAEADFGTIADAMSTDKVMLLFAARNVIISNLVLMNGLSEADGAGMLILGSSPILANCTFVGNQMGPLGSGAAIAGLSSNSFPVIINCNFLDNSSMGYGGAIASVNATLVNCLFRSNQAGEDGGAIEICLGRGLIEDCTFIDNEASMGGAIHAYMAESIVVRRCLITDNIAYSGGGIHLDNVERGLIEHCQVIGNIAQHNGGGVLLHKSSPAIGNCLISGNQAGHFGGGVLLSWAAPEIRSTTVADNWAGASWDGISSAYDGRPTIVDCILWGNRDNYLTPDLVSYSNVQDQLNEGPGNISEDPLFVKGEDCAYFLSQTAAGQASDSPCVGSGSADSAELGMHVYSTRTDFGADTGTVDMGYHVPVAMPRIYAWRDSEFHACRDFFRPIVSAGNEGPHMFADVYAGFVMPGGEVVCLTAQGLSGQLSPWIPGLVLEHGFSFGPQVLMEYEIPDDWALGEYMFFIAFCLPGQTEPIGDPALFTFAVVQDIVP